jgi:hypothetical protein
MKFLIEFNPPTEVKNKVETSPELKKKVMQAVEDMKPDAAWFTLRRGFFVIEANSTEELTRKTAALFNVFETDPVITPAISMEEFGTVFDIMGEEGRKILS